MSLLRPSRTPVARKVRRVCPCGNPTDAKQRQAAARLVADGAVAHPTAAVAIAQLIAAGAAACLIAASAAGCRADQTAGLPVSTSSADRASAPTPFFKARSRMAEYAGPGRETPPPTDLAQIEIGWFGPSDPDDETAGLMWLAAKMAVDEANRDAGDHDLPFVWAPAWSSNPWAAGVTQLARLVYDDGIWAVLGAPDGASAHLAAQIAVKTRLPFVSPVSTDKTTNLANVPWVFSCAPGDDALARAMADWMIAQKGLDRWAVVTCTDHDSRAFSQELLTAMALASRDPARSATATAPFPERHLWILPGETDFRKQVGDLSAVQPAAIVLIAGPADAARLLVAIRQAGVPSTVLADARAGRRAFAERAGPSAEGVVLPLLWHEQAASRQSCEFAERFRSRFQRCPDYAAAHTYDAARLLLASIRQAGLNRAKIRDALRAAVPWAGVTGIISWDPLGQNRRPVEMGVIRNSTPVPIRAARGTTRQQ